MAKEQNLAHTKWLYRYHIVFTPKYRRKVIYGQYREEIGKIIRQLCNYKGIEIIEGHMMIDHVHMLVMIPPKYAISSVMGYIKGKSSLMIFDKFSQLKYRYGNRRFWSVGYYVSTVGLNEILCSIRGRAKNIRIRSVQSRESSFRSRLRVKVHGGLNC